MAISMYLNFNFRYNIKAYTKCKNISSFAREDFLLISTCNKRERERWGEKERPWAHKSGARSDSTHTHESGDN
jgi:hypothetical protein